MQIIGRALNDVFAPGFAGGDRLMAFDQNANNIISYTLVLNENGNIVDVTQVETQAVALELAEGESVEFVTSRKIDIFGEKGMALVFSDGETEGTHRLVIVGADTDGSILQETHSWDFGSPVSISSIDTDGHDGDNLFITTSDSPFAVIFKSGEILASPSNYLPVTGPEYFDLGVGHGAVAPISGGSPFREGLIVNFPDENSIRILERD